jgi:hypothetical protein
VQGHPSSVTCSLRLPQCLRRTCGVNCNLKGWMRFSATFTRPLPPVCTACKRGWRGGRPITRANVILLRSICRRDSGSSLNLIRVLVLVVCRTRYSLDKKSKSNAPELLLNMFTPWIGLVPSLVWFSSCLFSSFCWVLTGLNWLLFYIWHGKEDKYLSFVC